ncbi:uncharacterized protein KY384_002385 [Bacidia gigantensis]|uniref:uncharacterized protein n=1 Tax=Bacidia gigantensis TaxID=2732470 RepID=UPI001D042C68|nr:uncharacterized protein KY384_002385 [Bacidia gigantensis]KAG8532508.1 hypothetical protein KY384_002385 [Bacidia gigantensis]
MPEMEKLVTCLYFNNNEARKAADFYAAIFPDSHVGVHMFLRGPLTEEEDEESVKEEDEDGGEYSEMKAVEFSILNQPFLGVNVAQNFRPMNAVAFRVFTESQEETDRFWNAIVDNGGQELNFGWCVDRWKFKWQFVPWKLKHGLTDLDPVVSRRVVAAMKRMKKIDVAKLEAALRGEKVDAVYQWLNITAANPCFDWLALP